MIIPVIPVSNEVPDIKKIMAYSVCLGFCGKDPDTPGRRCQSCQYFYGIKADAGKALRKYDVLN